VDAAVAAGIPRDQIVVDPGIGFGKTVAHNLTLLRGIAIFHSLGCPILLGASRKRFISAIGGGETAGDRVSGSVTVALFAARRGVQILRVHDIFATKQALDLEWAIGGAAIT
jgi:dihydropteroate synthase